MIAQSMSPVHYETLISSLQAENRKRSTRGSISLAHAALANELLSASCTSLLTAA